MPQLCPKSTTTLRRSLTPVSEDVQETIIVLGMHRSGTSLVAELLHGAGLYAGDPPLLLPANEWNERGYWEYLPLVRFNDDLLAFVDASWSVPPASEDEPRLRDRALDASSRAEALQLINSMESGGQPWFWKDPRLGLVLPFWQRLWRNPAYVVCIRNPLEIAQSLQRRFHFPISASLLLWQIYMTSILRHVRNSPHVLFIEYERLVQTPSEQCDRLFRFVREYCRFDGPKIDDVVEIVRPNLKHHESRQPFNEVAIVSAEQDRLYSFLRTLVDGRSARFEDDFSLYPGYREYLQTVDLLRQWLSHWHQQQARIPTIEQLPCSASTAGIFGF